MSSQKVSEFLYVAYLGYQEKVVGKQMLYERFASVFLETCDHVIGDESEGEYRSRMNHARELLKNRPLVAQYFFNQDGLKITDMEEILRVINTTEKGTHVSELRRRLPNKATNQINMTDVQVFEVVKFANKNGIFKENLTEEMLSGFFSQEKLKLQAANNTLVAMFLDAIKRAGLIIGFKNSEIERRANLFRATGNGFMKAGDLSSALSKVQKDPLLNNWREVMKGIAKAKQSDESKNTVD